MATLSWQWWNHGTPFCSTPIVIKCLCTQFSNFLLWKGVVLVVYRKMTSSYIKFVSYFVTICKSFSRWKALHMDRQYGDPISPHEQGIWRPHKPTLRVFVSFCPSFSLFPPLLRAFFFSEQIGWSRIISVFLSAGTRFEPPYRLNIIFWVCPLRFRDIVYNEVTTTCSNIRSHCSSLAQPSSAQSC
jgi:hypothetical protein